MQCAHRCIALRSLVSLLYIFFFSSRRRHTRFDCDWSSDVCSSDLSSLIRRNTTIPTSAKELFTTFVDGQTSVDIHILQGERELAKDNRSLARFQLKIPPVPAGVPRIEVTFMLDANGILSVTARDVRTGEVQSIEVKPSYGLTDQEVERMIRDSFVYAKQDIQERQRIEAMNEEIGRASCRERV